MRGLLIMLLVVATSAAAFAEEPRWCSVSKKDPSNTLVYLPIAAAVEVQGEARARIIYRPNGRVERVEPVSGSPMLAAALAQELPQWTVRSNAPSDEPCQTLVVAAFSLRLPRGRGKEKVKFETEANSIYIYISKPRPIMYETPARTAQQGS
jgi:hypothetical protein